MHGCIKEWLIFLNVCPNYALCLTFIENKKTIRGPKSANVPVNILHPMTTFLFHDKDVSNIENSDKIREKDALRNRERSKQAAFFVSGSAFYNQEMDF